MFDTNDNHPNIYSTGDFLDNSQTLDELTEQSTVEELMNVILLVGAVVIEYGRWNCYISTEKGCFLICIEYIFKNDCSMESFDSKQSGKRRTNVMTRYRIPELWKRQKNWFWDIWS